MNKASLLTRTLLLFALIVGSTSVWGQEKITETIDITSSGYENITVTKAGTSGSGSEMIISQGSIVVSSDLGYVKSGEMSIYKNGSLTISFAAGTNAHITKVVLTLTNSYNFNKPDGWTSNYSTEGITSKVTSGSTETFTTDANDKKSLTLKNSAAGKTGLKQIVVEYETEIVDPHTVTFADDNSILSETEGGQGITLPIRSNTNNYNFIGWSISDITIATLILPEVLTGTYYPTEDITLYPVYSYTEKAMIDEWREITTAPEDGTYAICTDSYFLKAEISDKNRFNNGDVAPNINSDNKLDEAPADDCIWEIYKASDGYYRIKNGEYYAGGTSTKNQGALLTDENADLAKWEISYNVTKFDVINFGRSQMTSDSSNKYLKQNSNNGWATYGNGTGSSPRLFMRFYGEGDVMYYVTILKTSVTITPAYDYISFSSTEALDFTDVEGLTAFVVSADGTSSVTLSPVMKVPANTGLVIKKTGEEDSYAVPVFSGDADTFTNLLVGTADGPVTVTPRKVYVLNGGKFKLFTGTEIPQGKAYLPATTEAPALDLDFGEGTTGIQNIERTVNDNQYYDLSGRRVAQPTKGLYIVNGKKVIIK
ncbi:MAG: hypothetical protein IJP46_01070 [Prevotella sp.]|nr:hypothetical protein [Prevotella sp.]